VLLGVRRNCPAAGSGRRRAVALRRPFPLRASRWAESAAIGGGGQAFSQSHAALGPRRGLPARARSTVPAGPRA